MEEEGTSFKMTYHESQKKAIKNYFQKNKDKLNARARERYKEKMSNPEYKETYNKKMRDYYNSKKEEKLKKSLFTNNNNDNICALLINK
jgi:hypothetical protein